MVEDLETASRRESALQRIRLLARKARSTIAKGSTNLGTRLLPESRVRAYLLPTGSAANHFFCSMDFREVIDNLKNGFLNRPRLEIWAGRSDIDRKALASSLRDDFTSQLEEERKRFDQGAESDELSRLRRARDLAGDHVETAAFALTSSLIFLFLVSAPVFNLVFMALAVFSGAGGVTKALHHLSLSLRIRGNRKELRRQQEELKAELDQKNEGFMEAVKHLEIRIHPSLLRLVSNICEVGGTRPPATDISEKEAPSLLEALENPDYRQKMNATYHSFLDLEIALASETNAS